MGVFADSHTDPTSFKFVRADSGDLLEGLLGLIRWGAVVACLIAFTVGAIMLGAEFLGRRDKKRSARWMLASGAFGALLIGLGPVTLQSFIGDDAAIVAATTATVSCRQLAIPVHIATCIPPQRRPLAASLAPTTTEVALPVPAIVLALGDGHIEGQYYVVRCLFEDQELLCLHGPHYFPSGDAEDIVPFQFALLSATQIPPEGQNIAVWRCEHEDCSIECDEELDCTYTCEDEDDCSWAYFLVGTYEDVAACTTTSCGSRCTVRVECPRLAYSGLRYDATSTHRIREA